MFLTLSTMKCGNQLKDLKADLFVLGLYKNQKINNAIDKFFDGKLSSALKIEKFNGEFLKRVTIYSSNNISRVLVIGLGEKSKYDSEQSRITGSILSKVANSSKLNDLFVDSESFQLNNVQLSQSFAEGLELGNYQFLDYKTQDVKKNTLKKVGIFGKYNHEGISRGMVIGQSVNYARSLGNHPANILTPTYLANESKKISKAKNMKCKVTDVSKFQEMGLGSFYGVARGAKEPAKMIIVEYNGGPKSQKPIALVGKGLTFDTGGISLKPSPRMDEMKFDMCGSATVMGLMNIVSILQPKINIVFAIGSTENMPGSDAQRPGDIVTAYNGKTIEVLNTDAEGRLVLADVLSYVNKNYNPKFMIDFATLTGAVLVALGNRATGLMGNDENLIDRIKKSSEVTGEKVWELPLWDEYSKDIKGKYADIQNLGKAGAGTITAGAFLKEFVDKTPWCHLDIAGTAWGPKEPHYQPKVGATGVAVRLIYHLIEN